MAKILVVDDEEPDRVLERVILERAGHELLFASDGETALTLCRNEDVELVITDLAMPTFNGLRFIKEIREEGLKIAIIAVSGRAVDQLDLAQEYGADVALAKPLEAPELLEAVDKALNRRGPSRTMDPWSQERN